MIEQIRNICIYLILSQFIIQILPKNSYTKYIKLIMGAILIIMIIRPISNLLSLEVSFDSIYDDIAVDGKVYEFQKQLELSNAEHVDVAKAACEKVILEAARNSALAYGYEVSGCEFNWRESEYHYIDDISMVLTPKDESEMVEIKIDEIRIEGMDGESGDLMVSAGLSPDILFIKKDICEVYNIDPDNIYIDIRRHTGE